jgi:hypothetical protein
MIKSNTLWHKYYGINLAVEYKIRSAIPYIELERNNRKIPPGINDLFGHTISQRAEIALKKLKNKWSYINGVYHFFKNK